MSDLLIAHPMALLILGVAAYLLGSFSGAIMVSRLFSLPDPRQRGSGNPGATNVYRIGGIWPACFTLLIDVAKGALPVLLAKQFELTAIEQGIIAFSAITGHMMPVFFSFRGGKGVATALGAGLILAPQTTATLALIWILTAMIARISSVASLTSAIAAPFVSYFLTPKVTLIFLVMSFIIVTRHRENVINLVRGKEPKIGQR